MGYDRDAPKRAVSFSLNEDLVRAAAHYTSSLDGTLEALLEQFVAQEQARQSADETGLDRCLDHWSAFHAKYGLLSEDFPDG